MFTINNIQITSFSNDLKIISLFIFLKKLITSVLNFPRGIFWGGFSPFYPSYVCVTYTAKVQLTCFYYISNPNENNFKLSLWWHYGSCLIQWNFSCRKKNTYENLNHDNTPCILLKFHLPTKSDLNIKTATHAINQVHLGKFTLCETFLEFWR